MKNLLIVGLLLISLSVGAQVSNTLIPQALTIADLKTKPMESNAAYLVLGIGEGGGTSIFYWQADATGAEDAPYYNFVTSNLTGTGRWVRNTVRNQALSSGFLETNGQIKTITLNGTTNSSGLATFYLTYDGTSNGVAIPTVTPFSVQAYPQPATLATSNDIVFGQCQAVSVDRKSVTCRYGRGQNVVVGLLGLTILGFRDAATATPVSIQVKTM